MSGAGDNIMAKNALWTFGEEVSEVFDEHVRKSVPFYDEGHKLICRLSDFFISSKSLCYDLGCSTGELTIKLAKHNKDKIGAKFIGVEIEEDMVKKTKQKSVSLTNVEFVVDDILQYPYEMADMIIAYYTIQFTRPRVRQDIINIIYNKLNWGGAFIMFEKVRGADARFQDILTALYTDFKLEQGYNADEIINKMRSLKGILEPFSTQGNIDLLKRAGFADIITIMKYVCFEGFLAIK